MRPIESPFEAEYLLPTNVIDRSEPFEKELFRFWKKYTLHSNSIITDLFKGVFVDFITCKKCSEMRYTFEPFVSLNLSVSSTPSMNDGTLSLLLLLESYFGPSEVKAYCEKCQEKTNSLIHRKIGRPPASLVICLNRIIVRPDGQYAKDPREVKFDKHELSIGKYLAQSSDPVVSKYNLQAATCHYGPVDNGIYYPLCCNLDDLVWRIFTPENLYELLPDKQLFSRVHSDATMLFYQLSAFDSFEIGQSEEMLEMGLTGNEQEEDFSMVALHKFLIPYMANEFPGDNIAQNVMILINEIHRKPLMDLKKMAGLDPSKIKEQIQNMVQAHEDLKRLQQRKTQNFGVSTKEQKSKAEKDDQRILDSAVENMVKEVIRKDDHPIKEFAYVVPSIPPQAEKTKAKRRINAEIIEGEQKETKESLKTDLNNKKERLAFTNNY